MKRLILAAALALSACNQGAVQTAGSQAVVASDATYTAASKFGETMVKLGKLDETKYKDLDNRAYSALLAVRAARNSATSATIIAATTNLSTAVAALYAAVQ